MVTDSYLDADLRGLDALDTPRGSKSEVSPGVSGRRYGPSCSR